MAVTREEQLAWEQRQRPRAGVAAILAGALTLAGYIWRIALYDGVPSLPLLDSLGLRAAGQQTDIRIRQVLFLDDRAVKILLDGVVLCAGAVLMAVAISLLASATIFRTPPPDPGAARRMDFMRAGRVLGVAGPVIVGVSELLYAVTLYFQATGFANDPPAKQTESAAKSVLESDVLLASQYMRPVAALMLGFALVIIALNAMRLGLLTRFMGVLGIFVGVLFVIPLGSPVPVVPSFWFGAVGLLLLNRWPQGAPPAWQSGKAEPWPSSGGGLFQSRPAPAGAAPANGRARQQPARPEPLTPAPSPATSRKKKRKRR